MKRIISLMLSVIIVLSSCFVMCISTGAYNTTEDVNYVGDLKVYNTVIKVPGLTKTYKFLQVSDIHASIVPEDTSSFYYNLSVTRKAHFDSFTDVDYLTYLPKFYEYARSQGCSSVLMTGDILDYPSDETADYMYDVINENSDIETMFTLGNHDWTFPNDSYGYGGCYSQQQRDAFYPYFIDACVEEECGNTGNPHGSYIDFGEVVVVMLNDCEDTFVSSKCYTVLRAALELNKPTIVCYHVPVYSPSLSSTVISYWGKDCVVGSNENSNLWNNTTQRITKTLESNQNIVGLFTGHIHTEHVDLPYDASFDLNEIPSNGALQYSCPAGYEGGCRLITITGDDSECEHNYEFSKFAFAPTCTVRGTKEMVCSLCGDVKYEVAEKQHTFITISTVPSTCTVNGTQTLKCFKCNTETTETLPLADHDYTNLIQTLTRATYRTTGTGIYKCANCTATIEKEIPALEIKKGDVTLDGRYTSRDIQDLKKYLAGKITFDSFQKKAADYNGDRRVNSNDLKDLKKYVAGN